jgi:hypothetical protein
MGSLLSIDTGAEVTVMASSVYKKVIQNCPLQNDPSGNSLEVWGISQGC